MALSEMPESNPIVDYVNDGLGTNLPGINATIGQTIAGLAAIGIFAYFLYRGGKNIVGAK